MKNLFGPYKTILPLSHSRSLQYSVLIQIVLYSEFSILLTGFDTILITLRTEVSGDFNIHGTKYF